MYQFTGDDVDTIYIPPTAFTDLLAVEISLILVVDATGVKNQVLARPVGWQDQICLEPSGAIVFAKGSLPPTWHRNRYPAFFCLEMFR